MARNIKKADQLAKNGGFSMAGFIEGNAGWCKPPLPIALAQSRR